MIPASKCLRKPAILSPYPILMFSSSLVIRNRTLGCKVNRLSRLLTGWNSGSDAGRLSEQGAAARPFQGGQAAEVIGKSRIVAIAQIHQAPLRFDQGRKGNLPGDVGGLGGLDVLLCGRQQGLLVEAHDGRTFRNLFV